MLSAINVTDIKISTSVSFQMYKIPVPFSIMFLTITINHRGGMILLMICNGSGIFLMGKIKPDKRMVGSMSPSNEINMATIWFGATVEINMPKLNAININRKDSPISRKKLPFIGTPKTKTPNNIMVSALMNDNSKYGVTLPKTI